MDPPYELDEGVKRAVETGKNRSPSSLNYYYFFLFY